MRQRLLATFAALALCQVTSACTVSLGGEGPLKIAGWGDRECFPLDDSTMSSNVAVELWLDANSRVISIDSAELINPQGLVYEGARLVGWIEVDDEGNPGETYNLTLGNGLPIRDGDLLPGGLQGDDSEEENRQERTLWDTGQALPIAEGLGPFPAVDGYTKTLLVFFHRDPANAEIGTTEGVIVHYHDEHNRKRTARADDRFAVARGNACIDETGEGVE